MEETGVTTAENALSVFVSESVEQLMEDFAALESTDTVTRAIIHPKTGDDMKATFTVYGQESETYKTTTSRMRARITQFVQRNPGMKPDQKQKIFDSYEKDRNISCIKSIDNFILNGQPLTDPKTICDKYNWIYNQICGVIDGVGNFIAA